MTLRGYLQVLLKRWRILTACTLLVLNAAAALTYLQTPLYAANATSFVSIASSGADNSIYQSSQFAMQRVKSYSEVVKSPEVLQPVIDQLDLPMTVRDLRGAVSADNEVDTVLITVSATDPSPERAQAIANAVSTQLGVVIERLETPRDGGKAPVKVTTTVPSQLPQSPISPRVPLNLALGLLAGLAFGIVVAVIREQQDTTIKGDELEQLTGRSPLALIGVIPNVKTRPLITMESQGRGVEEFRSMRATLQFVDVDQPPRVIVVTSSLPGEGKTTTAVNLAIALAQSSMKVCLVEADMRRPMASTMLGIDGSIGLSNVVAGQLDLDDSLLSWHRGLLKVLPAGTMPPDPSKLLGSKNMAAVLSRLRADFDYVVIDAPPVLPVSDALVLARSTDGAVLVSKYGKTRREQLSRAVTSLESVQARLIGPVLTMVPPRGQRTLRGHDEDYASLATPPAGDWTGDLHDDEAERDVTVSSDGRATPADKAASDDRVASDDHRGDRGGDRHGDGTGTFGRHDDRSDGSHDRNGQGERAGGDRAERAPQPAGAQRDADDRPRSVVTPADVARNLSGRKGPRRVGSPAGVVRPLTRDDDERRVSPR